MGSYLTASLISRLLFTYNIKYIAFTGESPWVRYVDAHITKEVDPLWQGIPEEWASVPKLLIIGATPESNEAFIRASVLDNFGFIIINADAVDQVNAFIQDRPEYSGMILPCGLILLSKRPDFKVPRGLYHMEMSAYMHLTGGIDGERPVTVSENWKSTVPVQGWFHIAILEAGDHIASELHGRLIQSGLYRASTAIHVAILGDPVRARNLVEYVFSRHQKYDVHYVNENVTESEWASLKHLHKTAMKEDDFHAWYIHTKGASNCRPDVPFPIQRNIRRWRDVMCHYTIGDYKKCQYLLDSGYDTVGPLFKSNTGIGVPHYAGNFWWATAKHIRRIPELTEAQLTNRSHAEAWVCSPGGNHFNQYWIETSDLYGFEGNYGDQGPFPGYEII
jgi:hypothetical protein